MRGDILQFNSKISLGKNKPVRDYVEYLNGSFLPIPHKSEDVEIIGNIYENNDLLQANQ